MSRGRDASDHFFSLKLHPKSHILAMPWCGVPQPKLKEFTESNGLGAEVVRNETYLPFPSKSLLGR